MSHPDPLYDDYNDFYQEDLELNDHEDDFDNFDDYYEDTMDGDHDSAMTSCGWGTDEDYGHYGDCEDFHSDDGCGYYDDGE